MDLKEVKIGFVLTGSFCTFQKVIPKIKELVKMEAKIIPIMSSNSYMLDTKFGKAKDFIDKIEEITGNEIIHTIPDAEPIGPKKMTDIMIIAPCSRKYHFKTCLRYNRYTSCYGCKYAPNLMTGNKGNDNTYLSNNLVELDCDAVSEIFKKLKKTTSIGQAFEYKIDDDDYEKETEQNYLN